MGMGRIATAALAGLIVLAIALPAGSRGGGGSHSGGSHGSHSSSASHSSGSSKAHASSHASTLKSHASSRPSASKSSHPNSSSHSSKPGNHQKAQGAARDSHGKIARSEKAKDDFKKSHACPSTGKSSGACPGYVIDHVKPLKRGGPDDPSNMQWQTAAAAKAKDKIE